MFVVVAVVVVVVKVVVVAVVVFIVVGDGDVRIFSFWPSLSRPASSWHACCVC